MTTAMSLTFMGIGLLIVGVILAAAKEVFFPYKSPLENKGKLEAKLAKLKKEEVRVAEEKRIRKASRICPRITTWLGDEYKRFFRVYCHEGTIYHNVNKWTKEGLCAMASECPGAYHRETLTNKTEVILNAEI